jgi:pimeloyl-ACP methyl ester carboxylesterase
MTRSILLAFLVFLQPLSSQQKGEYLVCVHGFMGGSWSMYFLEKNLRAEGWDVLNWAYPSRDAYISDHGARLSKQLSVLAQTKPGKPIHFVTHSMGGLVLLSAMNHPDCPVEAKVGRVILIAPPLQGCDWGRRLSRFSFARWIAKDFSGYELMTQYDFAHLGDYPDTLEKVLVIAGSLGFNPFIAGANDGTITLSETSLAIPHERIVISRGHRSIVFSKKVCNLACQFLAKNLNLSQ